MKSRLTAPVIRRLIGQSPAVSTDIAAEKMQPGSQPGREDLYMNTVLKRILCTALAAGTALPLAGCSFSSDSSGKKKIGLAMPAKSLERWNRDGEYLKRTLEAEGYEVELRFSDNDIVQQVNDLQVLIADDVDLLIVAAIDGAAVYRTLEDAELKHIPIIAYDRLILNTEAVDCYISFDNFSVGVLQAQYIIDHLDFDSTSEPYNLEIVAGDTADNNALYFYNGAMSLLDPMIQSGKLRVPSGKTSFEQTATPGWSTDVVFENMQNTLASYYADGTKLDAVLASSDVLSLGVTQAILSDYAGGNMPIITGQDGDIPALRNIVNGTQTMAVYKNAKDEANVTVEVAKAILSGQPLNADLTAQFEAESTFDNESYFNNKIYVPSYLLKPSVITADNIGTLIDTGAYKWDSEHKYLISAD